MQAGAKVNLERANPGVQRQGVAKAPDALVRWFYGVFLRSIPCSFSSAYMRLFISAPPLLHP
jgi:hypothetical protein